MRGVGVGVALLLAGCGEAPEEPFVPRDTPVLHVDGDQGYTDVSDSGLSVTCDRCPTAYPGHVGEGALWFDGDAFLRVGYDPQLDTKNGFTVSMWFRPDTMSGGHALISRSLGTERDESFIVMQSVFCGIESRRVYFHNGDEQPLCSTNGYDTRNWNHVAATWDGRRKWLYVNGSLSASMDSVIEFDTHDIIIGADENEEGARIDATFIGALDDIRLYERPLEHAEIVALPGFQQGPIERTDEGMIAGYRFAGGSGETIAEINGGPDLTIETSGTHRWTEAGLELDGSRLVSGPRSDLVDPIVASDAFTLEAWIRPLAFEQSGAILQLGDATDRNFALLQGRCGTVTPNAYYTLAVRTASVADGCPGLPTLSDVARPAITHLVATRAADGTVRIFVDGFPAGRMNLGGDLSGWSSAMPLVAGQDWRGELVHLAIYGRALSQAEVGQNFQAGP